MYQINQFWNLRQDKSDVWSDIKVGENIKLFFANGVQTDTCDPTTTSKANILRIFCEKSGKIKTKKDGHQVPLSRCHFLIGHQPHFGSTVCHREPV